MKLDNFTSITNEIEKLTTEIENIKEALRAQSELINQVDNRLKQLEGLEIESNESNEIEEITEINEDEEEREVEE